VVFDELLYETELHFIYRLAEREADNWLESFNRERAKIGVPELKFNESFSIIWEKARILECVIYKRTVERLPPYGLFITHAYAIQIRRRCGYRERIAEK
jgi:hypothetical protein